LGRGFYRALIWPVSWYYVAARPVARRASIEYLRRVGCITHTTKGWHRWRAAARHVRSFADALLDKALVWAGGLKVQNTQLDIDPQFESDVAQGKGGVMVVAHFGNLEVLRALGQRAKQLRLHILVHTHHAQRFNRMLERMNPDSAARLLQVTQLDAATVLHLTHCVAAGDYVVIAADRVPTSGERTLDIPFLGAHAPMPIGPWVLAAALHCPIYWLACYKTNHAQTQYTLKCERLYEQLHLPRATREHALRAAMHSYAVRLEQACHQAPYAWFNFYPYWVVSDQFRSNPKY